jgi:hypothetical protein
MTLVLNQRCLPVRSLPHIQSCDLVWRAHRDGEAGKMPALPGGRLHHSRIFNRAIWFGAPTVTGRQARCLRSQGATPARIGCAIRIRTGRFRGYEAREPLLLHLRVKDARTGVEPA